MDRTFELGALPGCRGRGHDDSIVSGCEGQWQRAPPCAIMAEASTNRNDDVGNVQETMPLTAICKAVGEVLEEAEDAIIRIGKLHHHRADPHEATLS